ncbi:cytochrome C oxidase Cbb3 [Blattabacterium cuenoti]|uniref:cytochrome C oxidase Cbb3 n=1 Tax=Blattabacterium cuenoti TaxID=1653831 RepID=UPI00163CE149|nr:cytochrome C oxidase Cbb3 [Blattabacterium cuenoti]
MKIKFNLEIIIISSLSLFICFIIYITFFFPHKESELISNRYYEEEMRYQEIINEKQNLLFLSGNIKILMYTSGIYIIFPKIKNNIFGTYTLLRYSSKNMDVKHNFEIVCNKKKTIFIPCNILKKGNYKLMIRWTSNKTKYFFEKDIFWNE